ncbi:thioredoxin family protein [Flavisolibacter ginsenosidimutans]|uniref:Thioredoxin family protein n=1 Tax=Flavisolibacter ginsenosidimutans TaxID=661481 RepID=A0A5B8UL80_9BACT|nr:thioredoxin family protein [Flavisolibacter ginsenosidimutans]QEC56775.1 thioredoxin family protein [Flavisolibacter ginsenosidimutans]
MKKFFFFAFAILSVQYIFAQTPSAEISRDSHGNKVVKGFLTKQELLTDTAFAWFPSGQKSFTPNADAVKSFAAGKDAVNILVFGGTWCEDTHMALPHFFVTADAAGFSPDRITLIGVDRSKKTLYNLSEAFGITNVPTFIVMKNGKEIGRVVEFGTTGYPEREVAEMVAGAAKK